MSKLTKREKVLLLMFSVLLFGGGYFLFILQPGLARIQELQESIETTQGEILEAETRAILYVGLLAQNENLQEMWDEVTTLPPYFDDQAILNQLHSIVSPHVESVSATFDEEAEDIDYMYTTTVEVVFWASKENLVTIVQDLANYGMDSRIIDYEVNAPLVISDVDFIYVSIENVQITLNIEYLTMHPRMLDYNPAQEQEYEQEGE